jgi:hypothetical protein
VEKIFQWMNLKKETYEQMSQRYSIVHLECEAKP